MNAPGLAGLRRGLRRGLREGFASIRRAPLAQLIALGTIAVALLLVGLVRLTTENLARLAHDWDRGVQLTVYLDENLPRARGQRISEALAKLPGVESVRYIESREAYTRLRHSLGDRGELLDGVEETMLPASIEVGVQGGAAGALALAPAFERLRRLPGVEDVELMGDWVARVHAARRLLSFGALGLALLVAAACLYIVASTIRLGVFARRDEIEIQKLCGATDGFVRAPFLVEGLLQGVAGAGLACGLLYGLHRAAAPWIETTLGSALLASPLVFLPPLELLLALLAGALLGLTGSGIAVSRHVRA